MIASYHEATELIGMVSICESQAELKVQAVEMRKALAALEAATSVPSLTEAFQLTCAVGRGTFTDEELRVHRQRLVMMVERSIAEAGSDAERLHEAVALGADGAAAAAASADGFEDSFTGLDVTLQNARIQIEKLELEGRRRQVRMLTHRLGSH